MERKIVRRGGIRSAGYDRNSRELEIELDSGAIVRHSGVGEEIARRFLTSAAPASFYKDNIEEEYPARRVR
ncbi:conserved hypothetical protein [Burkholderiales bacterium]|jgi:hypothetical protein|nr:conserved hypothetical protein [Burkholderiales bacterium]